jgi:O-antigen/teichoic acid export membrane protein
MIVSAPALRPIIAGVRPALSWWQRDAKAMAGPMIAESVLLAVSGQAAIFVLALASGSEAVGILRAAQVCFMPIALTVTGCAAFAVPHLAQRERAMSLGVAVRIAAGLGAFALVGSVATLVAAPILHDVLYARAVALPVGVLFPVAAYVVLSATATGYVIVVKVRRRSGLLAAGRLSSAIVGIALLIPAAAMWGVTGAAWSLVAQGAVYLVHLAWGTARVLARRLTPPEKVDPRVPSLSSPGEDNR